jgi:uncharacterized repeat protein (TIGR01451 family)
MKTNHSLRTGLFGGIARRTRPVLLAMLGGGSMLQAHNLDTKSISIQFANDFIATMAARSAAGQSLLQIGDEFWVYTKTIPGPGTKTGVGGYTTFYLPAGYQVLDAAYVAHSNSDPRGFIPASMKGQSSIAIGAGPIAAKVAVGLTGYSYPTPNILGINESPVTATGISRGTIAGVYADTGIFYSTDARTSFNSYGAAPVGGNPPMKNNHGDIVGEWTAANTANKLGVMTLWDSYQLRAFGRKDVAPIIDAADGRGNAPWGLANAVAGPQSGYQWAFNYAAYDATIGTIPQKVQSGIEIGPWNRIKYPGSQVSRDQAGSASKVLGYAGVDASFTGYDFSVSGPLPSTVNAVRFSIGQLELGRTEYAAVKIRILPTYDSTITMAADAFGGDAGSLDRGKDHLWRYFDPTVSLVKPANFLQKHVADPLLLPGGSTYFDITFANAGAVSLPNVVITDTLPKGLAYVSALPAPTSVAGSIITWNLGTMPPGAMRTIRLNVKATATGILINHVAVTSNGTLLAMADDAVQVGVKALLRLDKTVTPSVTNPGATVRYTITVYNEGTGNNGTPLVVGEFLPAGFSYLGFVSATLNGAAVTAPTLTINSADLNKPTFTLTQSIQPNKTFTLTFDATVGPTVPVGTYYNFVQMTFEGKIIPPIPLAPVTVGGGQIGDTVYRDWNGNGAQDAGEEGMPGVVIKRYAADGTTLLSTTTTDANGNFLFAGLVPATYVIKIDSGVPAGYVLTDDPDVVLDGQHTVTLALDQEYLTADFGYLPGGTASISSNVFEDVNNSSTFDAGDIGIPSATVRLYTPAGNLVATTTTNGSGDYLFSGLAAGLDYRVAIDPTAGNADLTAYFAPDPFLLTTMSSYTIVNLAGSSTPLGFGFFRNEAASLGGTVFNDVNRNGSYTSGTDSPLANVTVRLYNDVNANGLYDSGTDTLQATTSSGPDGTYLFSLLPPGNYVSVVDTSDPDIPEYLVPNVTVVAKTLVANENYTTADFPFVGVLIKSADKTYAATGEAITFTLDPVFPASELFSNLRVLEPIPLNTTYVAGSATASGGTFNATFVPQAAVPGSDGGAGDPLLETSLSVSSNFTTVGSSITVTLNVKNDMDTVGGVSPSTLEGAGGAFTILTGPTPASATVNAGPAGTDYVWTVQLDSVGEFIFSASASDSPGLNQTVWPTASSASVLAVVSGGPGVISWDLGTNVEGVPSEVLISGTPAGIYGLRGANSRTYAAYSTTTSTWSAKANHGATAINVGAGGALTTDGVQTVYALAGNTTQKFSKYDVVSNTWTALADYGSNVKDGGALCYLEVTGDKYVYGLQGNNTNTFRRYDIVSNTWSNLASVPVAGGHQVNKGGALTTDGTYIYALSGDDGRGSNKKAFYRYTPGSDSWSAMANTPGDMGEGAALTRIDGYIYALRGKDTKNFYRYNIAANTWSTLASVKDNVKWGGALATDGTSIYAFRGAGTANYWKYNPATNVWSTLTNYTANVGSGGSLAYVPAAATNTRTNIMSATPSLVTTGDQVTVTMRLKAENPVSNIVANAMSVAVTGGASAAYVSGPTLISVDDDLSSASDEVVYQWVYTATAGTAPCTLTFSASALGDAGANFLSASSNSVLVAPHLMFQVTVDAPGPVSGFVSNTGIILDDGTVLPRAVPSNTTLTATSASIGELVWNDTDGDGVQDPGEFGLQDVIVNVYAADGITLVGTATTDALGHYRVFNLAPGSYVVRSDPSSYPPGYIFTTPNSFSITLVAGEQNSSANFGAMSGITPAPGSIGDRVWIDLNADGIVDAGEDPLPNIGINLERFNLGLWTPIATTTTDAGGAYSFSNLPDGTYRVTLDSTSVVTSPYSGAFTGTLGAAMNPTYDLDGVGTPHTADIVLGPGSNVVNNADFGYHWAGTIGDFLWYDTNGDGVINETDYLGGPRPAPNGTVILYVDLNSNGVVDPEDYIIGTEVTGDGSALYPNAPGRNDGQYLFEYLPPGTYIVEASNQEVPSPISGLIGTMVISNGDKKALVLGTGPGQSMLNDTTDYGFIEASLVTGSVFHDENYNGVFDAGEPPLSGISVYAYGPGPDGIPGTGDDVLVATTTSAANGSYSLRLTAGDYIINYNTAQIPAALSMATTALEYYISVTAGTEITNLDFGRDNGGVVGGTVFRDGGTIGAFGAGDTGLIGVVVELYSDPGYTTIVSTTITNASGLYSFPGLADGTYYVRVNTATLPAGTILPPTYDPDAVKDSQSTAIIAGGGSSLANDFGYNTPPTPEIAVKDPAGTELSDGLGTVSIGGAGLCYTSSGTFIVRNDGSENLNITSVTIDGPHAAHFAITTTLLYPVVVAPGTNTPITVLFSAVDDGLYTATLHIFSNDADEASFDIGIEGTGANRFFTAPGAALKDGILVAVHGADYTADNHYFTIDLGFAPTAGDQFTALALDPGYRIIGHFFDLPDNGVVALAYQGTIYYFQANYMGGEYQNSLVLTNFTPESPPAWAWLAGPKARNNVGKFAGLPLNPGARQGAAHFKRPNGNLWTFGGYGYGATPMSKPWYLNDLWEYNRSEGVWRFVKGSSAVNQPGVYGIKGTPDVLNTPGARHSSAAWDGCDNNFWLFGGFGPSGRHNDLWRFNPDTEEWTWMHGSNSVGQPGIYGTKGVSNPVNTPGARQGAVTWTGDCDIWLFGGTTDGGVTFHNDLWRYSVFVGEWTWMGGPNTSSTEDRDSAHGTFGIKGTGDVNNIPGARRDATGWATPGRFWVFGGTGFGAPGTTTPGPNGTTKDTGDLNDLWAYEISSGKWTWVSGSNGLDTPGVYGTPGQETDNTMPGARSASSPWATVDGKLWFCGGLVGAGPQISTYGPQMNDIWTFNTLTNRWAYQSGSQTGGAIGTYGIMGVRDARNHPSGRWTIGTMVTLNGSQWFFGGGGIDGFGSYGRNSDLWNYGIPMPVGAPAAPAPLPFPDDLIINSAPTTGNVAATTMAAVPVSGQVTGRDSDGDIILFSTAGTTLSQGTLNLQSNGQWTYTPAPGFVGTDTFTFKASDYYGGQSPTRTLTITVTTNPADADNDGIADSYEQSTFGSTGADALGDADGDGQSNYFEYLAGTSPVDAAQTLTTAPSIAAGSSGNGGSFKLNLNHVRPGVSYHLETSTDLDVWNRIGTFTFSVSGSATIEDPTTPPAGEPRFYRVSLEAATPLP